MSKAKLMYQQLAATCRVRYLEKRRNVPVTLCEYLSHLIIIMLLILGYSLSIVEDYPATVYSQVDVQLPPKDILNTLNDFLQGPLVVPTLETYLSVNDALSTFTVNDELITTILEDTSIGQLYGNLFIKGDLHFAPAGPLVDNLIHYLNQTTPALKNIRLVIHLTEDEGVNYILNNIEDRTFAFIVLREISTKKVNYKLRMNYTTLPNTNEIINVFTLGLDPSYQSYFLSGYLSVQSAVDSWVMEYLANRTVLYTNSTYDDVDNGIFSSECNSLTYIKPNNVLFVPYPTYKYEQNPFYTNVGFLLGLAMTMATMFPMSR